MEGGKKGNELEGRELVLIRFDLIRFFKWEGGRIVVTTRLERLKRRE